MGPHEFNMLAHRIGAQVDSDTVQFPVNIDPNVDKVNLYDIERPVECDVMHRHYARHVTHMTRESLHSKMAIATELAVRDAVISLQNQVIYEQQEQIQELIDALGADHPALQNFRTFPRVTCIRD
jgi:hypothetical protein